jgi:DNA transformation protein
MPSSTAFRDQVLGRLLPFGPVNARAMFGGYGLYLDGLMFGLIAYDTLYFKVDDGNRDDYIEAGTNPFTYEGKRRPVKMSYYQIPEAVMTDPGDLAIWAERAHQAAKRSKAKSPPRRKRSSTSPTPRHKS